MLARLFEWFISSPPATLLTAVGALIYAMRRFRKQSRGEHRSTLRAIDGVSTQLNGELHDRMARNEKALDRIEKALGISEADQ